MSQIRKGTVHRVTTGEYEAITESCVHHYVKGLRLTRPATLWELAQQINAGVFFKGPGNTEPFGFCKWISLPVAPVKLFRL